MIYELIAKQIENYLGGDYLVSYANNHDTNWNEILPDAQDEMKHCVLRVDSGSTTQVGGQTVRTEQLRLIVAIPEQRDIFNKAVTNLRSMLNALNNTTITDSEENITALLYFGEYHDAQSQTVNGNIWWIAEVVFIANFYDGVYDSNDTKIEIQMPITSNNVTTNTYIQLGGIINIKFLIQKTFDNNVYNGSAVAHPTINSISMTLQVDLVYLKNNDLINYLLTNEETLDLMLPIKYYNGIKTRSFNADISSIAETTITGDILKATITFTNK